MDFRNIQVHTLPRQLPRLINPNVQVFLTSRTNSKRAKYQNSSLFIRLDLGALERYGKF